MKKKLWIYDLVHAAWCFLVIVLGFALVVLSPGCHDGCEPETMRCNGDRVEICNTEEDWELSADCSDIEDFGLGIKWTCCIDSEDDLHSCLPVEECSIDAGLDGGVK